MGGISLWQFLILILLACLFFLPTIIAVKRNHPYKVPIILINIIGGLLWGIGWLVSLIWSFILPKVTAINTNVADELEKLHALKEKGIISDTEFEKKKTSLMNN